jgi:hypothetical protein
LILEIVVDFWCFVGALHAAFQAQQLAAAM